MLKVVLGDDEPMTLKLLQCYIQREGQAKVVGMFSRPFEALANIKQLKPDAVFLDIEMPDMNGIELAGKLIKEIKKEPRRNHPKGFFFNF